MARSPSVTLLETKCGSGARIGKPQLLAGSLKLFEVQKKQKKKKKKKPAYKLQVYGTLFRGRARKGRKLKGGVSMSSPGSQGSNILRKVHQFRNRGGHASLATPRPPRLL